MPKTKLQNIIFTLIMAFVMVYAMVCYNIALDKGGMTNEIFLLAFHEIPIMWPIACILEYFVVEKLSRKLAFRMVSPEDKPIFITLAISSMIVCLMCPVMSFIATCLFMHPGNQRSSPCGCRRPSRTSLWRCAGRSFSQAPECGMSLGLLSGKMAKNKKNEKQCKEQNRLLRLDFFLHRVYTVYSLKMITRVRVDARHSFLLL